MSFIAMEFDKMYFDQWDHDFLTRVNMAFRGIALLFVVPVFIFSFWRRSGVLSTVARGSKICLQVSGFLWIVAITLSIAALCDSTRYLSGVGEYQQWMRLSMVAFFFQVQAFALLLVAQLGFAAGLRRIAADSVGVWIRSIKYLGIVSYVLITLVNIGRLIAFELHVRRTFPLWRSSGTAYDFPFRVAMAFEFAVDLLFFITAFSITFLTFWVRPALYRTIYILLGMAAVLTLICSLWRTILQGIRGLGYFYEDNLYYHDLSNDVTVATVAVQMWMPVVAMFLIALALGKTSARAQSKV
jgi:hypothetical protein